jgi:hypothetical protein
MVRIQPKRFPREAIHKLHHRSTGPFKILHRLGPYAYHVELNSDLHISPIFNVEDITAYTTHFDDNTAPTPPLNMPKGMKPRDEIEAILEDQIVSTRLGNCPLSDCSWLRTKVQRLYPIFSDGRESTASVVLIPLGKK